MPQPRRRIPAFALATTLGVLIGLVIQILLTRQGVDLTAVWRNVVSGGGLQMRLAMVWWTIAGVAFVASFIIASVAYRFNWLYLRFMKGALGLVLVYVLAEIGHVAPLAGHVAISAHVATSLGAFGVALVMSGFGAYFAVRS